MKRKLTATTLVLLLLGGTVYADSYTPLTLPTLTDDIRTWTHGSDYDALFPTSQQTLGGVPFKFQSDAERHTVFYGGTLNDPVSDSLVIPVNLSGVTKVFTLINTAYGAYGYKAGSVSFEFGNGDSYTVDLIEGLNVRDHYYGDYCNVTDDLTTQDAVFGLPDPGNAHFDMQVFDIAAYSGETLTEIVFTSTFEDSMYNGKALLAGATVLSSSTVPDGGSTLGLLVIGLGLIAASRRSVV